MNINTTRFGPIEVPDEDVYSMPEGLVGFRGAARFALWSDPESDDLAWLQSTDEPSLAFALVPPRVAAPDYQVEIRPGDRAALGLADGDEPLVLVVLNLGEQGLTVNLQGPLAFNPRRRLARQLVLTSSRYAVRFPLGAPADEPTLLPGPGALRASA